MESTSDADADLATVAVYGLRHQAEVAKAMLASAGIDAMVVADDEGGLNPGFFADYGVRVVVRSAELAAAQGVLEAG
ncbi:MAG: hypothetical protein ACR2NL_13195 [Acidimicrobiia bacterium]